MKLIANYESKSLIGAAHVSVHKYKALKNLPHWHMEHELIFAAGGGGEVMAGNCLYKLSEGACVFVRGEDIHYISSPPESEIWIMKTDPLFTELINGRRRLKTPFFHGDDKLRERLHRIWLELHGMEYGNLIADSLALIILGELYRSSDTEPVTEERSGDKYKALIKDISVDYREYNFDRAADFMCLSRPYFSKYFHRMSGMTFTEYLNIVRVSAAAEMISRGGLTMTEIADRCGFGTIRSFNRVFRELTGCSPGKLPENYELIRSENVDCGFDPTLGCTVIVSDD